MACYGSSCVEATLKRLLNKCAQSNPHLLHMGEVGPFFERFLVSTSCEEKMYRIVDQLAIGEWVVAHDCNFSTIRAASEEDFGGIEGGILTMECCILYLPCGRSRWAKSRGQLVQNCPRGHAHMPSLDGWVIGHLEDVIDT
jgi:hypothetical protein